MQPAEASQTAWERSRVTSVIQHVTRSAMVAKAMKLRSEDLVPLALMNMGQAPIGVRAGCSAKIRSLYPSLRRTEQQVADFVLRDPEAALGLSARELARECSTSEASVVRFCQNLGYQGLPEFRTALMQDVLSAQGGLYEEITADDAPTDLLRKVVNLSVSALNDTLVVLDPGEFGRAVEALLQARRLHFFGAGGSAYIAQEAALKFLRLSIPTTSFIDRFSQVMSAALLGPGDVAIGLSYTGVTKEVVEALTTARQMGATTICITNFDRSPITQAADIKLLTGTTPTLLGGESGQSRVAQLTIIDALGAAVALHKQQTNV
jgi:RpiR family transcriptional regulator, carbohydrate utilization regulator